MSSDEPSCPSGLRDDSAIDRSGATSGIDTARQALDFWTSLVDAWWRKQSDSLPDDLRRTLRITLDQSMAMWASVVAQIDKAMLYRSNRDTPPRVRTPLLIIYALVNRHYMTDLEPRRSMIRRLLDTGLDVYFIDWAYPDRADSALTLDDYLNRYVDRFVDGIRPAHGVGGLNILGICQGGTLGRC